MVSHNRSKGGLLLLSFVCLLFTNPIFTQSISASFSDSRVTQFITSQEVEDFPVGRANLMMAYDIESDVTIIYGGWKTPAPYELGDTWAYNLNNDSYTNMDPTVSPPVREVSSMVYDSQSDRIVMFGGMEDFETTLLRNDTWLYDYNSNTWENVTTSGAPSPVHAFGMVYDTESDRVILFGGNVDPKFGDTWAYDVESNTWENMNPTTSPSPRYFHSMAYDEESDIVILFAGRSDGDKVADTWAYDYNTNTWTDLAPSLQPSWRRAHYMTYDNQSDLIVLFGGSDVNDLAKDDTWTFDYDSNTWAQLSPSTAPSPRLRHNMVYDQESDKIITFGGTDTGIYGGNIITTDTTWIYDTDTVNWTRMSSAPNPVELSVSLVSHTPKVPTSGDTVSVLAYVIDDVGGFEVDLQYKVGNADWTTVTMTASGEIWSGEIPAHAGGTTVTYRIFATDTDNNEAFSSERSYTVLLSSSSVSSLELIAMASVGVVIVIMLVLILRER
ncbi:MAG: Kelch repeat-containing protein [Candidatus Thorarchaeota archaeon]